MSQVQTQVQTQTAADLTSQLRAALSLPKAPQSVPTALDQSVKVQSGIGTEVGSWASVYGFTLPRDEQVALLLLQGYSRLAVAKELEISAPTVYRLVQTQTFKTSFHKMQEEIRESSINQQTRLELLCTTAIDNIADVLFNSEDPDLKVKTSLAVLDRGGHSIKQQAVVTQKFEIDEVAAALISKSMHELKVAKERQAEVVEV